jgi:hypothetical protein
MFENSRTKAKASELRAYRTESELDAKRRLEAAGWNFGGVDYAFEDFAFKVATPAVEVTDETKED